MVLAVKKQNKQNKLIGSKGMGIIIDIYVAKGLLKEVILFRDLNKVVLVFYCCYNKLTQI